MNGLELYSVLLAALERSAMRFDLRREPQKDSCKAAQGKCSFPWDGIGLAHKRQLRFHDRNFEEDFTEVYNTYKRLVYHTAYKIMDDSYLAEDVLQEVFLYVAKNFSKIHRENCHELAAYLVSCSRSRAYDMLRKQREELLEDVPNEPDAAPVPDDAAVSTDNIERLTELIGQMKPMYRDPLRLLAMGYTNREIAKSLGLTDEVVRTRLFRGRKLLWKEMNSHE